MEGAVSWTTPWGRRGRPSSRHESGGALALRYQTGGSGFEIPDWGLFPRLESGQRGTTPLGGRGRPRCRPVSTGSGGVLALRYQTGALALRYQTGGCYLDPKVARGVPRH